MKNCSILVNDVLISVIIPTYNRVEKLKRAVESVLNQTFQDFEIIIVNDSKVENDVVKMLNEFNDNRIKYFRNQRKKGGNGARNTGIMNAKGKYMAMLDDDDVIKPDKLGKQFLFLEKNPKIGLVSSQAVVIDEKNESIRVIDDFFVPEDIYYNLIFNNCIVHSSVMMRPEIIKAVGYYDEALDYAQDYELWCRMIKITCFAQINEKLTDWREHKSSITGKKMQYQESYSVKLAINNINNILNKVVTVKKMIEIQNMNEKGIFALRGSILLFQDVYRVISNKESIKNINCGYKSELIKKSMINRIERSLYSFFSKRSPLFYFFDFLFLPFTAKLVLLNKIKMRLMRILK